MAIQPNPHSTGIMHESADIPLGMTIAEYRRGRPFKGRRGAVALGLGYAAVLAAGYYEIRHTFRVTTGRE